MTGILFIVYMGYMGSRLVHTNIYVPLSSFMIFIIPLMIYTREDKFKALAISCSLPTTRKDIVLSRYLTSWILMLAAYFLSTVLVLILPGSKLHVQDLVTFRAIFLTLFLMTLFLGVLLPLLTRFGTVALFVFLISLQLLGIIGLQLRPIKPLANTIKALAEGIRNVFLSLSPHLGTIGYAIFLIGLMLFLNYISLKCSEFIFSRKEL
jgi:ABC-type transport system involved in multi-copper enzyme maturation permease subunit